MTHTSGTPVSPAVVSTGSDVESYIDVALDQLRQLEPQSPELRHKVAKRSLDAALIGEAATRRGLDVITLNSQTQIIADGSYAVGFYQNMASPLTALDRLLTNDKLLTKGVLERSGVPVAHGGVATTVDEAIEAFHRIGPPVVVKPIVGSGGKGITVSVQDEDELRTAAEEAFTHNSRVLVEEMVAGIDLRIMTIAGKAVAAMLRVPANVVGDGTSTIRELIDQKNEVRAGNAYLRHCPITVTSFTEHHLAQRGLTPDSVPEAGRRVYLHYKANLSSGGDSYEIVDLIHPEILRLAEKAAATIRGAYHAGVDVLLQRFDQPPDAQRCIVCELNLNNEMPIHIFPLYGIPTPTDDETIEGYFVRGRPQIESGPHRLDPTLLRTDDRGGHAALPPADDATPSLDSLRPLAAAVRPSVAAESSDTSSSPRGLDRRHLREEFERHGLSDVRFQSKLVRACRDGESTVFERSGRNMFATAVAGNATALHRLLVGAGIPALGRFRGTPADLDGARAMIEAEPGSWRLRTLPRGNGKRSGVRLSSVNALERVWARMPETTTRVVLEQVPHGAACSVLMVGGRACASLVVTPPAVLGDGSTTLGDLLDAKLTHRAAHPYLRHFPVRESLLTDEWLARRDRKRTDVLADGEIAPLGRSPLMSMGPDTVALRGCPFPGMAETAVEVLNLVGQVAVASVMFAQTTDSSDGNGAGGRWAVWELDADPVVAHFAYPWAGESADVYGAVAAELLAGPHYVLSE